MTRKWTLFLILFVCSILLGAQTKSVVKTLPLAETSAINAGVSQERLIYQKAGIIDAWTTENVTIKDNIKKLAKLPLHFEPGSKYSYGEGLDVLGYFIEVVSGMPFNKYLKTRLFDPLGMNDTWFYLPEDKANRLVAVREKVNGEWRNFTSDLYDVNYPIKGAQSFFAGGAGLSSTVKDYAIFLQMFLNGGEYNGTRILSRTTVQSMLSNQTGELFGTNKYFCIGFSVVTPQGQAKGGEGSAGTFDWGGYFNTQYFADPVENVIGIIMKQTQGPINDQTGWKFRQLVFQSIDD